MLNYRSIFSLFVTFVACAVSAVAKPPNVLLIVVDDQSPFDLKVYNGASELDTPNIDRIAKQGMVLDAAYHMGRQYGSGLYSFATYDHEWSNRLAFANCTPGSSVFSCEARGANVGSSFSASGIRNDANLQDWQQL